MTKNKKILFSVLSLALLAGVGGASVFASQGENRAAIADKFIEKKEAAFQFFENNDFEGWKNQIAEHAQTMRAQADKMEQNATQENFEKMKQIHALMQEGKFDEAKELRASLQDEGLMGQGMIKMGRGFGRGMMNQTDSK